MPCCRGVFNPMLHLTINSECLWQNLENAFRILGYLLPCFNDLAVKNKFLVQHKKYEKYTQCI